MRITVRNLTNTERTLSVLHETGSKNVPYKNRELLNRGKKSKKLNEVKPLENTNKNCQTFEGISHGQTKVCSSH